MQIAFQKVDARLTGRFPAQEYPFRDQGFYSTDSADVSWATTTVGLGTATSVLGTATHSWQAVAAGGMSIGHEGTRLGAETLALTAAELLQSPELIEKAMAEFEEACGLDFSYSALPGDRQPPLDYRVSNYRDMPAAIAKRQA